MSRTSYNPGCRWARLSAVVMVTALLRLAVCAQQPASGVPAGAPPAASKASQGVELDRVVAVVNDDVILESDVDEEQRFLAFQPFRDTSRSYSRDQAINRLIDRTLIRQQARLQPEDVISDMDVDAEFAVLRKSIPACLQYQCETDAGWERFVEAQGFTMEELRKRWKERMELLRFITVRFRSGIHISDSEIKDYYDKTLLPEYARQKTAAPKLEAISARIQEILLQQQVGNLLVDWLNTLRAQGTVRTLRPREVAP